MDDYLHQFVHDSIAKGISREEIEKTLLSARWPRDEIQSALDLFADIDFPIPVPRPKPYLSAREAFIYLVMFTMLYLSAWSLGSVLFDFINRAFPDPTQSSLGGYFDLGRLRWSVATLLVACPGYLLLSNRTYIAARRDPERRKSKVRKWLTYLTLFLAASVILGDLITLVFNLLEGELTTRFVLKVLAVAGIAGSVFGYYFWDLKQDDKEVDKLPDKSLGLKIFASGVTATVAISLIGGLYIAGSPGSARKSALDRQREHHLAAIANMIDIFWKRELQLPGDLAELERTRGIHLQSIADPVTGALYTYDITGESTYDLCAVFDAESRSARANVNYPGAHLSGAKFWQHGKGNTCFSLEVANE